MSHLISKSARLLSALFFLLAVIQVQSIAQCGNGDNPLNSKIRYLGGYDSNGRPDNLVSPEVISPELRSYINNTLPEGVNLTTNRPELISEELQFNTILLDSAEVFVTFVHEGAAWTNSLGFYTFDVTNPPETVEDVDSLVIILPNVTRPQALQPGDRVSLGVYGPGVGIGYFLIAKGWSGDTVCINDHIVFTDKRFNTFTTPGIRQHTVLLNYSDEELQVVGIEDQPRPSGDRDFNDVVFYIKTFPDVIDTVLVPELPRAVLTGDTAVCSPDDPASINVAFRGPGPYDLVYNNGSENIEIKDIEDTELEISTTTTGNFSLVSVRNRFGLGQVSGSAEVSLVGTSATLDPAYSYGCDVAGTEITVPIIISGVGDWKLQYSIDDQELSATGSEGEIFNISAKIGQTISLMFIQDELCEANLDETIELSPNTPPELAISGTENICESGGEATVTLAMSGQAPFNITYSYAGIEADTTVENSTLPLTFTQSGSVEILSFSDKNCQGTAGQVHEIKKFVTPTAQISGNEVICTGDMAELSVQLSGTAPYTFTYAVDGNEQDISTSEENYIIETNAAGNYTLVAMSDAHCEGKIDGSASVEINELPSAVISGGGEVCGDDMASVEINLTGQGSWTLRYLEGNEEKTLTSNENLVTFEGSSSVVYTLISISDAHCENEASGSAEIVNSGDDLQASLVAPAIVCFGEVIELTIETDVNISSVAWSSNGAGSFILESTGAATYQPAENESGTVTISAEIANACGSEVIETTIEIKEMLTPEIILPVGKLYTNTQYSFNAGDQSLDSYNWSFGDGNFSDGSQAFHEYTNGGLYEIELTVVDDEGCEGTVTEEVEIFIIDNLYIPNVFNPDALNDENRVVKVYGENVSEDQFSFRIFNRWGKVMYETSSFTEANSSGWDGRAANNDEKSLNVFSWIVKGKFVGGDEFEKAGTVTLVR